MLQKLLYVSLDGVSPAVFVLLDSSAQTCICGTVFGFAGDGMLVGIGDLSSDTHLPKQQASTYLYAATHSCL